MGPAGALVNILNYHSAIDGVKIIPWLALVNGAITFLVWAFNLQGYCTILPISVLEGFSLGVALTIGLSQFNFAFQINPARHKHFYMNVYTTFS